MKNLRAVRAVTYVSDCNCLREVVRERVREVREVNAQVIDFIAGGESKMRQCAPLVLHTTRTASFEVGPSGFDKSLLHSLTATPSLVTDNARFHGGML